MNTSAHLKLYLQRIIHICLVLSILLSGTAISVHAAPPPAPAAAPPPDASSSLFSDNFADWTVGGGFIYWAENCLLPGETIYFLKRKPLAGGATVTIQSGSSAACNRYTGLAADDRGVYYYNPTDGQIEHVPVTLPNGPPIPLLSDGVPSINGDLLLDSERVYWGTDQGEIYYVAKSGGNPELLITTVGVVEDIEVDGSHIYWIDDDGVWWANKNCAAPPCAPEQLFAVQFGMSFTLDSSLSLNDMHRTLYLWHGENSGRRQLMRLPASMPGQTQAELLYEVDRIFSPGPVAAAGVNAALDTHLYWTESHGLNENPVRRLEVTGGEPDDIYLSSNGQRPGLRVVADEEYLYFALFSQSGYGQVRRIPLDAAAIERDIRFTNWEVTQAIQNLENDVPLVADKPTVVRVYGAVTGGDTNVVQAWLEGRRNGIALPGSPLLSINGPHNLRVSDGNMRATANKRWIFELPADWISAGTIELTALLDPYQTVTDPDRANNNYTNTFTFHNLNDVRIASWPIRTHAPIPSAQDPNVSETFDLFERLWPIDQGHYAHFGEPIEELEICWWTAFPYPCYGPYELNAGRSWTQLWVRDRELVMLKLIARKIAFETHCLRCGDDDSVHALGLVHANTFIASDKAASYGNMIFNAAYILLPQSTATMPVGALAWPRPGQSLAHELAHNLGRGHIDCGNPKDHVDSNYPYGMSGNQCVLDDRGPAEPTTYFGYDLATYGPIPPTNASDFLGYSTGPRWTSDYTFKGIYNSLGTTANAAQTTQATGVVQASATASVFVSGLVEPNAGLGHLEYAYVEPNSVLNPAAVQKVQQSTAFTAAQSGAKHHIRFLDARGQLLGDHSIVLSPMSDDDDYAVHSFAALLPAPAGSVSRIELMADNQVLFTRKPGPAKPTVTMREPVGGANVDDALVLRWTGVDPDADDILLYNVEYSPDNGQSWQPLVTDYPGTPDTNEVTYTLRNPEALPGTNGSSGLIRVWASDGYNTGMALSQPLIVSPKVPEAHILHPNTVQWAEAGEVAPLRGAGYDAEDGTLADGALSWTVANYAMGHGRRQLAAGFAPGSYPVTLQATDSSNRVATDQSTLNVAALAIPLHNFSVNVDGRCNDEIYQGGQQIQLAPYFDGSQATVQLVRTKGELAACFTNMIHAQDGAPTQAGLFFDIDHSQDGVAQANDFGFLVGEDGTPSIVIGDGSGSFVPYADNDIGAVAQVSATPQRWQAELRLSLNDMNPVVGLLASHRNVNNSGEDVRWPYRAANEAPITWGTTVIVDFPRVESATPLSATVGAPATILEIAGTHFAPTSTVTWDGQPLPTTFVDNSLLKATVEANKLTVPGNHAIQVVTPGLEEAPAPGRQFSVTYPTPQITRLMPDSVFMEGPAFDLSVFGTDFADGATVLWNGEPQPTVRVSATELRAAIPAVALVLGREVNIRVSNPIPHQGGSNLMTLQIESENRAFLPLNQLVYLPFVSR